MAIRQSLGRLPARWRSGDKALHARGQAWPEREQGSGKGEQSLGVRHPPVNSRPGLLLGWDQLVPASLGVLVSSLIAQSSPFGVALEGIHILVCLDPGDTLDVDRAFVAERAPDKPSVDLAPEPVVVPLGGEKLDDMQAVTLQVRGLAGERTATVTPTNYAACGV